MADKKENRGGARPGAGRKPIPPDDIARIKRMAKSGFTKYSIAKQLHYTDTTVRRYLANNQDNADADE